VFAVWDDFESAPVNDRIKAALRLIVRFVDQPEDLGPADFHELRALGVRDEGIEEVLEVAALFNIVTRVADALEFHIPEWEDFKRGAERMLAHGYV